ncbi:MAG TPA: GNAT family N-acetyltransferase [Deltaproteobacteria bacterium]|nr:GNAT family N-acetyltransferase [Deltaproteobacteria bacterium]
MKIEDADEIGTISTAITQKQAGVDFKRIIEEQLRQEKNACFVAEIEGKVVGFMISFIQSGGFGMKESAWVVQLGVDPKYMGQGIGDRLAKEVFKYCQDAGIKDIYTSVRWDSTDLLSFFKTLGFDRSNFINLRKKL